jgi:hypothetical protein
VSAAQKLETFAALLDLVAGKARVVAGMATDRDPELPAKCTQLRGALDVVEASIGATRRELDTIDGG